MHSQKVCSPICHLIKECTSCFTKYHVQWSPGNKCLSDLFLRECACAGNCGGEAVEDAVDEARRPEALLPGAAETLKERIQWTNKSFVIKRIYNPNLDRARPWPIIEAVSSDGSLSIVSGPRCLCSQEVFHPCSYFTPLTPNIFLEGRKKPRKTVFQWPEIRSRY